MADDGFAMGYALGNDGNKNGGGFMGGDGFWGIILLALLFGNGNGGFGNGGGSVSSGFAWQGIDNGIRGVQQGLCDGFYAVNTGLLTGFNGVQSQLASCCCDTQRAIERGFCETNANIVNQTRSILEYLTNDKIAQLRNENQTLRFQASQAQQNAFITANQEAQTAELIRRIAPTPVPAYTVPAPYGYGYGNYGGCGCGC